MVYRGALSMDIVVLGAPGSGKGTQAAFLEAALGIKHCQAGSFA